LIDPAGTEARVWAALATVGVNRLTAAAIPASDLAQFCRSIVPHSVTHLLSEPALWHQNPSSETAFKVEVGLSPPCWFLVTVKRMSNASRGIPDAVLIERGPAPLTNQGGSG
jgi:hypothetical protein